MENNTSIFEQLASSLPIEERKALLLKINKSLKLHESTEDYTRHEIPRKELEIKVKNDIENSLKHLNEGGTIVLHDCNPPTESHALEYVVHEPPALGNWNGTVYKSLIKLKLYRYDLTLTTVDEDWGVGILTHKVNNDILVSEYPENEWEFFNKHRAYILNLISESGSRR
mgnify:CR=1 FL=1